MKFTPGVTVAAVTGAGSGIGRELAIGLAHKGCHLSLSDIDAAGLEDTGALCEPITATFSSKILTRQLDVSHLSDVRAWAMETQSYFQGIHVLINNAGVALGCPVEDMSYDDLEWVMRINFWGMVYGSKEFLPLIKASQRGHIVNISSIFGLTAQPSQSGYNASKFAIRGFTESLRQELEIEQCNVGVTCVHPGGVKTNIAHAARLRREISRLKVDPRKVRTRFNRILFTSPRKAARQIILAIEKNKRRLVIGLDGKAIDWMQRLWPGQYQRLMMFLFKLQGKSVGK